MRGEGENGQRMDDYTDDWMDWWEEGRAGTWTSGGKSSGKCTWQDAKQTTETQKKRRRHKSVTKRSISRLKYQHNSLS